MFVAPILVGMFLFISGMTAADTTIDVITNGLRFLYCLGDYCHQYRIIRVRAIMGKLISIIYNSMINKFFHSNV